MRTLAVVGASYLQLPLVRKAKEMGVRTICFAWKEGAVCRDEADAFYPISIVDKEEILAVCRKEEIAGITSIATDVAVPTIAYVAGELGLVGNSVESAAKSTNKFLMREAFRGAGVPCPAFAVVDGVGNLPEAVGKMSFPLIVKPTDRSGSKGVTRVDSPEALEGAIRNAIDDSFCRKAIIEECIADMHEVSVEGISWNGEYNLLQITDKVTTGAPHYVELGHHQPARLSAETKRRIVDAVRRGVDALEIKYGASHAELMITDDDRVFMTEIGARMGGDFIGSHLVRLSTGYDFLKGVVDCALGVRPRIEYGPHFGFAGVWFYASQTSWVRDVILKPGVDGTIEESALLRDGVSDLSCSADRSGYFIYKSNSGRYQPLASAPDLLVDYPDRGPEGV